MQWKDQSSCFVAAGWERSRQFVHLAWEGEEIVSLHLPKQLSTMKPTNLSSEVLWDQFSHKNRLKFSS